MAAIMNWRQMHSAVTAVVVITIALWSVWPERDLNDLVLKIANEIPDGGGFCTLSDSGVARDIDFKGVRILRASQDGGYYCSGFTLDVFMEVARQCEFLDDREPWEIAQLQKEWYGVPDYARHRQIVYAMERLGVGREVPLEKAKAGDFVVFSRPRSGHAVILLGVVRRGNEIVGIKYRSAQPGSDGVGDRIEYFWESGIDGGAILRWSVVVGRLTG